MDYTKMSDEELAVALDAASNEAEAKRAEARAIRQLMNERTAAAKAKAAVAGLSDGEKRALLTELQPR